MNRRQKIFRWMGVAGCLLGIAILKFAAITSEEAKQEKPDVFRMLAMTEDAEIDLSWKNPLNRHFCGTQIHIRSEEQEWTVSLSEQETSYQFREGTHGKRYDFVVYARYDGGEISNGAESSALFVKFDELPDMPLLQITTIGNQNPSYEEAETPEGCWGHTIEDNRSEAGTLKLIQKGESELDAEMKIRVRGNTSAFEEKKPYKIKLESPEDLLRRGERCYESRDWALIADATFSHTVVGMQVAEKCGMEWQPSYEYVNVLLNGDWLGTYLLIETVERGEGRLNIGENGFVIENDVYWWNQDDTYFRTPHQIYEVGYTFCYPEAEMVSDAASEKMKDYLSRVEEAIWESGDEYTRYIDVDNWAGWLLTQDIMGTKDAGGANIFLYKDSLYGNDLSAGGLRLGPVWDMGSAYQMEEEWANVHEGPISDVFYFPQLLEHESFRQAYKNLWETVSVTLERDMELFEEELYQRYGGALEESRYLEAERSNSEFVSSEEEMRQVAEWFAGRKLWLDRKIEEGEF